MNKAILLGNITADPEIKYTKENTPVVNVNLATNESYKDKNGIKVDRAEFHSLVVWGKSAETWAKWIRKGSKVLVEGKIQTRSWEDDDGNKRYKTEIVVHNFEFAGGKKVGKNGEKIEEEDEFDPMGESKHNDEQISIEDVPF